VEHIHGPVVAGRFYPAAPRQLRDGVRALLDSAAAATVTGRLAGLMVPHAALQYSGPVAATAYRLIDGARFNRVVALGPSHFSRFEGLASLPVDGWRTPLGDVPIQSPPADGPLRAAAEPFRREHSLEVHLPFLQETLSAPTVTPLLFGQVDPEQASQVVEQLLAEGDLLLVSSDLSHYLTHEEATRVDRTTADAIVAREAESLRPESACGRRCIQAALLLARRKQWQVELLDLRTSADTSGNPDQVVGYGAFALTAAPRCARQ